MKAQSNQNSTISQRPIGLIFALFLLGIAFIYVVYFILFPFAEHIFDNLSQNIAMINSKLMHRY